MYFCINQFVLFGSRCHINTMSLHYLKWMSTWLYTDISMLIWFILKARIHKSGWVHGRSRVFLKKSQPWTYIHPLLRYRFIIGGSKHRYTFSQLACYTKKVHGMWYQLVNYVSISVGQWYYCRKLWYLINKVITIKVTINQVTVTQRD